MRKQRSFIPGLLVSAAFLCASWRLAAGSPAPIATAADNQVFDLQRVVDGVYAAIPRPAYVNNCNAAIILLNDSVLVVDTHSIPSAARSLIAQIKTLTDKPVKYVVDTHFHFDHYRGNEAYPNAWPGGVEIISSEATRENIARIGIPRVKSELVTLPRTIAGLKAQLAATSDPAKRKQIESTLRESESYLAELKMMHVTLPTLTFDRSLILRERRRTVEILWLGRAHTDGDVFAYLPKEKVIATGDVLNSCELNLADGYPYDWIKTLDRAEKLDFEYVIGGHGDVIRGKERFDLVKCYLTDLMAEVSEAYAEGATLREAERHCAPRLLAKYAASFPGGPPVNGVRQPCPWNLSDDIIPNIDKAYQVISGLTP